MDNIDKGLLPCPFCGSTDLWVTDARVKCRKCSAHGPHGSPHLGYIAKEVWNTRPTPPGDCVEALREAMRWAIPHIDESISALQALRIKNGHQDIGTISPGLYDTEVEAKKRFFELFISLSNARPAQGWVAVSDRLPEHEKCSKYLVEVVTPKNTWVDLVWWNCGWINFQYADCITRWHEVPPTGNRI